MTRATLAAACLLSLVTAALPPFSEARIIHRERSLYSTILVDQQGPLICLQFSVRKDQRNQSCMDRNHPRRMVFPYAKMMMTSLLLVPEPGSILVGGLGGGTLPVALAELFPEAIIDVIEIDPAVLTVAETYFDFQSSEHMTVILKDARVFTKRAASEERRYDLVMLDAFNGDYIPEHLMTLEYLEETRELLAPEGVLVANTFAISRLYDHESVTYAQVFGEFINLRSGTSANRVILATRNGALPDRDLMLERAAKLDPRLRPYDVRLKGFISSLRTDIDWNPEVRILTDQYAPANLLQSR